MSWWAHDPWGPSRSAPWASTGLQRARSASCVWSCPLGARVFGDLTTSVLALLGVSAAGLITLGIRRFVAR